MSYVLLFNICLVGIEYVFEILILLLLVIIIIIWTYAKLKQRFVHTLITNKRTGKHKDGGC